ncbi:MAG: TIGR04100 family radical SAM protein [Ruminococcus sp.]|nr:TIGR04100 family radical SAM protein [Ruminococcus sp.]
MTIAYRVEDKLYLNLTNRCPCACTFCIRNNGSGAYGSDPLWLEHEPTFEEVKAAIDKADPSQYTEVVFCGYGEPTEAIGLLCGTADYLRSMYPGIPTRLNTNGLADLIHGRETAHLLKGRINTVSVSLNAGTKEEYLRVTRPRFGEEAFAAMQRYAVQCKDYTDKVMFTVVDILPPEEMAASRALAKKLGVGLRIREYIEE